MAGDTLIDAYLAELDGRLGRVPDRRSVLDEVADHLWEKVERLTAAGRSQHDAQSDALAEFGDPDLVGRAFASTAHGGAAVPTKVSNGFGWVAVAGGTVWFLGGLGLAVLSGGSIGGDAEWWVFFSSLMAGFLGVLMLGAGVHVREGRPVLGWVALVLLAAPFGLMAFEGELWWYLTATLVGVAVLTFGLGARKLVWLFGALLALDVVAVVDPVRMDQRLPYEILAGLAILGGGAALVFGGLWLARETPVDQPDDFATA